VTTRGAGHLIRFDYLKLLFYSNGDPGLEEAVDDRLSFRRFAALPLEKACPNRSRMWEIS
jgi:hypothetical protein